MIDYKNLLGELQLTIEEFIKAEADTPETAAIMTLAATVAWSAERIACAIEANGGQVMETELEDVKIGGTD